MLENKLHRVFVNDLDLFDHFEVLGQEGACLRVQHPVKGVLDIIGGDLSKPLVELGSLSELEGVQVPSRETSHDSARSDAISVVPYSQVTRPA